MLSSFEVKGNYIDIRNRQIYPALIKVSDQKIASITRLETPQEQYILPGFIDAHIHIESSMVSPAAFSQAAAPFGTVATVSDPHEIANVCGLEGVYYMIENARQAAVKIHFGAPSCVPATGFETAGAVIGTADINTLMQHPDIYYLAEMMNFPGVLHDDPEILAKIAAAKASGKPVDGHAPGLRGTAAAKYIAAGISTDHECTSQEEALDKLAHGMKILIREGSAAKNFEALVPLFHTHPQQLMFCSDDKHPDELVKGHINQLVSRAIAAGYELFDVLYAACLAPIHHYGLKVGDLSIGAPADFIVVEDTRSFKVLQTYINGQLVAEKGKSLESFSSPASINHFSRNIVSPADFAVHVDSAFEQVNVQVIVALDGQLITLAETATLKTGNGELLADTQQDVLKIAVVNRYHEAPVSIGFIKNFGLQYGAIASSVAHDSHNIVVVGVDNAVMADAANAIINSKGGISIRNKEETLCMSLPIAGLMTDKPAAAAAAEYELLDLAAKKLGTALKAPFMTLSFMALPVIPSLKMTDKGLFNVDSFNFTSVY
ncbi:MAG: adenine deaminase [Bacteroidetes bacterium 43-16]|nr:MAG: adenine deaminase [Bacteroidetes bacterium 43-16]